FEARVVAHLLRNRDPALLVGSQLGRTREEGAGGLALAAAALTGARELAGDAVELVERVHGQTAVERPRHDRTPLELLAKPGRENHPSLGVEGVFVLPQKHVPPTSSVPAGCWLRSHPCPPLRSTL